MGKTQTTTMADLAAEVVAETQASSMKLLMAEMEALRTLMPGLQAPEGDSELTPEEQRAIDAAVEAGFDNMPV